MIICVYIYIYIYIYKGHEGQIDWAERNRLQQFWTAVGCSVYIGSGPPLSLVDLRVEGLRLANKCIPVEDHPFQLERCRED